MHENDEILFHEPFLMVSYCAEQNMIMLRWNGYASPENYKRGMTFVARQPIDEPARGHQTEPGANEGNNLSAEKQSKITMTQGPDHEAEIAGAR